jgi:four helix bundle protein
MPPHDLVERTRLFALSILTFCRRLPPASEAQEAAGQLRRAANSVRSNYRAARKGRSRAEFQAKLGTVAEEADECLDWLEYLRDGCIQHDPALIEEARALTKIFSTSVRTARENTQSNKYKVQRSK